MKNKIAITLCILLVVTNFVVLFSYYNWGTSEDITPYKDQIELLKAQNDSLKLISSELSNKADSIEKEIKETDSVIIEVNNWYEKELVDITNQPIASDVKFFTDYLSKVDSGFVSSDNSLTTEKD